MARHNSHFPFVNQFGNIFHLWWSWLHLIQKSNMVSTDESDVQLSSHHLKFLKRSSFIETILKFSFPDESQWISGSTFELLKSVPVGVAPTNKKTFKIYSFKHFFNLNDLLTLNNKVFSKELLTL